MRVCVLYVNISVCLLRGGRQRHVCVGHSLCVLVYAPGRTYAGVDCGARDGGRRGAAGVCRVRGLQLLIAGWYTDTDRGI